MHILSDDIGMIEQFQKLRGNGHGRFSHVEVEIVAGDGQQAVRREFIFKSVKWRGCAPSTLGRERKMVGREGRSQGLKDTDTNLRFTMETRSRNWCQSPSGLSRDVSQSPFSRSDKDRPLRCLKGLL